MSGFLANFQVMAVDMSYRLGWIDDTIVSRVLAILKQAKLPTAPPESMTVEMFKSIMAVSDLGCFSLLMLLSLQYSKLDSHGRLTRRLLTGYLG